MSNCCGFKCNCGCEFKSEIGYKIHISRKCDNGRYLDIIEKERMISKPIDIFIDELYIDIPSLFIYDNESRYEKLLYCALINIQRRNIPYYIRCQKYTYVKGWNNLLTDENKKEDDTYIDYKWSRVDTKDFINLFVEIVNNLINKRIIEKKLQNAKKIEINDFRSFYNYLKKISK